MAAPWEEYATAKQPKPWEEYAATGQPEALPPDTSSAAVLGYPSDKDVKDTLQPIAEAFGRGAQEGWGPERWGLSDETIEELKKRQGLFGTVFASGDKYDNPLQAADELFYEVLARAGQIFSRGSSALYRGLQEAGTTAGLHRDIVSMPDAFFGSPHPTGMFRAGELSLPVAEDSGIRDRLHIDVRPHNELIQAKELGVIGPEQPKPEPTFNDSPSELAERAVPSNLSAARTPKEEIQIRGHEPGEYDARGKEWIDKIDEPDDVRDAIEKIASENDFFPVARGGEVSPAARDAVAQAAGIDPAELDAQHLATTFDSDGKVRAVIQALRQTGKDFAEASRVARENPTPENLAAAAEAELRHTHVVEYTMGLRAESGRTLAAWKDLLRQTEETRAKVALRAKEPTGEVPQGTADIVEAAGDVRENLKTPDKKPGLQNLVDAARNLVDNADKPPPEKTGVPTSPEAQGLVDEARKVLKQFGGEKDAELETFREALTKLTQGNGALGETVEAARAVVEKATKAESKVEAEPKVISAKSQLKAAAKRLVDAADNTKRVKTPRTSEVADLMETARQAVGLLKKLNLSDEMRAFRSALESNDPLTAAKAARELIDAEGKVKSEASTRTPVEYDQIMTAARRVASSAEPKNVREAAQVMPDVKEIIDNAQNAVKELQGQRKSALDKLIDQAEQQAVNMTRQKQVKEPTEALPPELQGLIDKTRRVVDRFGGIARSERSALLLARTGRTFAEQEQLARSVAGLTPDQVAKVLGKLRTSAESGKPGWFFWLWQNGLISGLITHAGYAIVNTATVYMERVISPFFGALLDRVRGQNTSIAGPLYANIAMVHALPDAIAGAVEAFKTGLRVPLKSEMRLFERGEESPQTKGAVSAFNQTPSPDWGIWEKVFNETQLDKAAHVLGIPGKAANLMHTFFKILSENAAASTRAFQAAHEEGVSGDAFWRRYRYHLDNPTDDALRGAVNDAYSGAFMAQLSPKLGNFAHAISKNPVTKWMFPFQHIPWNIQRMSAEYTPLAVLGPEMRSAILGNKGAPAQSLAIAKMTVGSSILGYFMHQALSGLATGDYPQDATERKRWEDLRIRPNSLQIGGQWVSYERLGPIGNIAHLGASIGQIVHNYDGQDDEAMTSAIWAASIAAANQVGNEVGFQTLKNLIESIENKHRGERFVAWQAGSFMPASSFVTQNASAIDPYQRKAQTFIDGLKYRIPLLRESLLPKRDPISGEPLPNPSYHTIKPTSAVMTDPVRLDMDRLKYYPGPPQDRIGGVKLTPELHDKYEASAGAITQSMLNWMTSRPGWFDQPPGVRREMYESVIKQSRQAAQDMIQVANPQIIQQGVDDIKARINGLKPARKLQPQ